MTLSEDEKEITIPVPASNDITSEKSQEVLRVRANPKDVEESAYGWVCTGCVFFINGHTWGLVGFPLRSCL
jgi:hypothetical protein